MKLESFAFIGIKNLVIKDRETHATKCLLPHLVNLSLNDETARDYLRGGFGNPKLLTVCKSSAEAILLVAWRKNA